MSILTRKESLVISQWEFSRLFSIEGDGVNVIFYGGNGDGFVEFLSVMHIPNYHASLEAEYDAKFLGDGIPTPRFHIQKRRSDGCPHAHQEDKDSDG